MPGFHGPQMYKLKGRICIHTDIIFISTVMVPTSVRIAISSFNELIQRRDGSHALKDPFYQTYSALGI